MNSQFKIGSFEEFEDLMRIISASKEAQESFNRYNSSEDDKYQYFYNSNVCLRELRCAINTSVEIIENNETSSVLQSFLNIVLRVYKKINSPECNSLLQFEDLKEDIEEYLFNMWICSELVVYSIITGRIEEDLKNKLSELNDWDL